MVRLPRRFSPRISTVPSISAMTAGSLGLRASKISVTRGRPPVMSCVPETSRGVLASSVPAETCVAFLDFDVGLFGQVVEVEDLAAFVFQHDLRVQVALVLHDEHADVAAGVLFQPHRLAFDDVLEADLAADFGEDGDAVRVPLAEHRAGLDFLVLVDEQVGAGGDLVFFQLAALGVQQQDFAVAGEHDLLAVVVADDLHAGELDDAGFLGADFAFFDVRGRRCRRCGTSAWSTACPARRCSGRR